MKLEVVKINPDVRVRFYLSEDEGSYVPPHWHGSIEIVYVMEGRVSITCENRRHDIHENEFYVVNSGVVHSVLSGKNRALVLQVPPEFLQEYLSDVDAYTFRVDMHPEKATEISRLERIRKIFSDLYIVYDLQPEGYLLRFNSLLLEMMFMLVHSYSVRDEQRDIHNISRNQQHLSEILAYLNEHYREKIRLADLSARFGYNEDYLTRFFKKQTGMTITEYIYSYRVMMICRDLKDTDRRIEDIFLEHGGSNERVTMRVFREIYGCTPREKRQQLKEKDSA